MDDFADLMTDVITIESSAGQDTYGKHVYNAPVSYACRIDASSKQSVTINGVTHIAEAMVYVPGNPVVTVFDRLSLSLGGVLQQPPILRVSPLTDEFGPHHLEIAVGSAQQRPL